MVKPTINKKWASSVTFILLLVLIPLFQVNAQDMLGERNTLNLWDTADGTLITSIETESHIWQAMLNSDGTVIAALHDDGMVASYAAQSGDVLHTRSFMSAGGARFTNIQPGFLPREVFVDQNEKFWLWDYVADEILLEGSAPANITGILLNPDGERFLAATRREQEQSIIIYGRETGNVVASIHRLPLLWDIQWSPDGSHIAVAHRNGFNVFDGETGANLFGLPFDRLDVYSSISWSPDGASMTALVVPYPNEEDTEIILFNGDTLDMKMSIPLGERTFSAYWSTDSSQILATQYKPDGISAYDALTGDLIRSYIGDESTVGFLSAGWNVSDTLIVGQAVSDPPGTKYFIWEAETGKRIYERSFVDTVVDMIWDGSNSRVLFSVWPSSVVDVIDMAPQDAPHYTLVHEDTLLGAAWSADGTRILTWTGQTIG